MFGWIKKLFSRKKTSLPGPEPHSEDLLKNGKEEYEIVGEEEPRITKTIKEEPKKDVERPQKSCLH